MALTQEAILSFLLERGGKVKNSELLNSFRSRIQCGDPAEKQHNRELFKKLVNSVAVVKQLDEVKFVVVRKRYQDFVKEAAHDGARKTQMDDSSSSQSLSFTYTSPHSAEAARMVYSDVENNNMCHASNVCGCYCGGVKQVSAGGTEDPRTMSADAGVDASTVKVLNISGDQTSRSRRSGSVFAVIAVKSPSRDCAPATQTGSRPQVNRHTTSDKPFTVGAGVSTPRLHSSFSACKKDAVISGTISGKLRQTQSMLLPQGRPKNKPTRHADDSKYSESVPLEPLAHEWLVKCAAGLWGQIYALLLLDTRLAQRKDFMSGFTALHWAAKNGNGEIIQKLIDISNNRGSYININSKAHGGYTPLHIAAIHGHSEVMVLLVQVYGADVNARDNDGKKAFHYLGNDASAEMRALLGGLQESKDREKTDYGEYRDPPKGFNTISKLFQPHIGRKQKASTRFVHDW